MKRAILTLLLLMLGLASCGNITGYFGADIVQTVTINLTQKIGIANEYLVEQHENVTTSIQGDILTIKQNHAMVRTVSLAVTAVGETISQHILNVSFPVNDLQELPTLINDVQPTTQEAADETNDAELLNYNFLLIPTGMHIEKGGRISGEHGEIDFGERQNYTNIQDCLIAGKNRIGILTSKCPQINKSATITIRNAEGSIVQYSEDGKTWQACTTTTNPSCTNRTFQQGTLTFTASHFTIFRGSPAIEPVPLISQRTPLFLSSATSTTLILGGGNITLNGYVKKNTSFFRNTTNIQFGNGTYEECVGTANTCDTFIDESSCSAQSGCTWDIYTMSCTGTPDACNTFSQAGCSFQSGCSWGTRPESYRAFLDFNVSLLPATANITEVNLTLVAVETTIAQNVTIVKISQSAANYANTAQGNEQLYNGTNFTTTIYFNNQTNFTNGGTICSGQRTDSCSSYGTGSECSNAGCSWDGFSCSGTPAACATTNNNDTCVTNYPGCSWRSMVTITLNNISHRDIEAANASDVFTLGILTDEGNATTSRVRVLSAQDTNLSVRPTLVITYLNPAAPDTTPPSIHALNFTPNPILRSQTTTILANITDDNVTDTVIAQVQYPNGSAFNITLINTSGDQWNNTLSVAASDTFGTYNVTIIANDSVGNTNNTVFALLNVSKYASCPAPLGNWTVTTTTVVTGNTTCDVINITTNAHLIINNSNADNTSITLKADTLIISGVIAANGTGHPAGQGPGAGGSSGSAGDGSGGGYGGKGEDVVDDIGGGNTITIKGGSTYGSSNVPLDVGSGGGGTSESTKGSPGGGAIRIDASTVIINGTINANGIAGVVGAMYTSGGGSGGSVYLVTNKLLGNGNISANGGTGGGAGGGGRIALVYNTSTLPTNHITADKGSSGAEDGTQLQTNEKGGKLIIRGKFDFTPNTPIWPYAIDITNADAFANESLNFSGTSFVLINATLSTNQNNGTLNITINTTRVYIEKSSINNATIINISTQNFTLDKSSIISGKGAGFQSDQGPGAGQGMQDNAASGAGGSHGGKGIDDTFTSGNDIFTLKGGSKYDSPLNPVQAGSGGGENLFSKGGKGGGVFILRANTANISGNITVDGLTSAGGGAGGSINIVANTILGSGFLSAKAGTGGGGGMIMVKYNESTIPIENANVSGGFETGTVGFLDMNSSVFQTHEGWWWLESDQKNWNYSRINISGASTDVNVSLNITAPLVIIERSTLGTTNENKTANITIRTTNLILIRSTIQNITFMNVTTTNMTIDENSRIIADGAGFPPAKGPGAGADSSNNMGAGGGHGGRGADGSDGPLTLPGGKTYDEPLNPVLPGSGGGGSTGETGSPGGGVIIIRADQLNLSGNLSANGDGNGAGGSINIVANNITGNGSLTAKTTSGGGGGMIMVSYNSSTILPTNGNTSGGTNPGTIGFLDMQKDHLILQEGWIWTNNPTPLNITNVTINPGTIVRGNRVVININDSYIADGSTFTGIANRTSIIADKVWLRNATINGQDAVFDLKYNTYFNDSHAIWQKNGMYKLTNSTLSSIEWGSTTSNVSNLSRFVMLAGTFVRVNSTALAGLDTGAQITLRNSIFENPRPTRDPNDQDTYATCGTPTCTEISFINRTFIFNVTGFTSYSSEATPGTGTIVTSRNVRMQKKEEEAPDTAPAPAPAPAPSPSKATHSFSSAGVSRFTALRRKNIDKFLIKSENIEADEVACAKGGASNNIKIRKANAPPIPKRYTMLADPFTMDCKGDNVILTLSVSENYENVTTLKCNTDGCEFVGVEKPTEFECGGVRYSELVLDEYAKESLEIDRKKVFTKEAIITPQHPQVRTSSYTIAFKNVTKPFTFTMKPHALSLPQVDKEIALLVDPIEITQNSGQSQTVTIRVNNPRTSNVLEGTFPAFRKQDGKMQSLVTTYDGKAVQATFETNRTSVLGFYGIRCDSCNEVTMNKEYDGGSRHAIILIHGFMSSPATWLPLIEEFRLTKQPQQVYSIAYPSTLDFNEIVRQTRLLIEGTLSEFDTVDIVAHSMGGLITQQVLKETKNDELKNKLKKLILAGSPNDGSPAIDIYQKVQKKIGARKNIVPFLAASPTVVQYLSQGVHTPRIEGKDYVVFAGTKPLSLNTALFTVESDKIARFFTEPNDGVVAVSSAQHVGGEYINNKCNDYFEMPLNHGELIDNAVPRKIIARMVAQKVEGKVTLGFNQYVRLNINNCQPGYTYAIVGQEIDEESVADPLNCKCGNGVCGQGETELNCPTDCSSKEKKESKLPILIIVLLILLTLSMLVREIKQWHPGFVTRWLLKGLWMLALGLSMLQHLVEGPPLVFYTILLILLLFPRIKTFIPHSKTKKHLLKHWKPAKPQTIVTPVLEKIAHVLRKPSLPTLKPVQPPQPPEKPHWELPKVSYKPFVIKTRKPMPVPTIGEKLQDILGKHRPEVWQKRARGQPPSALIQLKKQFGTSYEQYVSKKKAEPYHPHKKVFRQPPKPVKPSQDLILLRERFSTKPQPHYDKTKHVPLFTPKQKTPRKPPKVHKRHMLDALKKRFDTSYVRKTKYVKPQPIPIQKRKVVRTKVSHTPNQALDNLRNSFAKKYTILVKPKPVIEHKEKAKPKEKPKEYVYEKQLKKLSKKFRRGGKQ